ncbi:MAG: dephospho-CoA kinase, partial [Gammaproteobacteria bacterium]
IGLTGGFASGKSTVAARFAAYDVPIIDTDVIARELVEPGTPALAEIRAAFGPAALGVDGRLDRAWVRAQVFSQPAQRQRLEALLHPRIHQTVVERLAALPDPYGIVVIPLLAESALPYPIDRVLVIDVPETVQQQRAAERDGLEPALISAILGAQATRAQRLAIADDAINNNGDLTALDAEVARLHTFYSALAQTAD